MEKLEKVIGALEMHEGAEGREVSCVGCPYEEYEEYCLTVLHKDVLAVIGDLQEKLKTAKDGRLELARQYQELKGGDLISRSALLAELSRRLTIVELLGVAEIVGSIPAVEAEPVVRCKDCRYSDVFKCGRYCDCNECYVEDNGFCSDGERRTDG